MMKPTPTLWEPIFRVLKSSKLKEFGALLALNIPMTVLKTVMHGKAYEWEGFSKDDRQLLFTQEWIRQSISTALWLTSLVGSYCLIEKFLPKKSPLFKLLVSNLLSSIPDTFIRPVLTAKISRHFLTPVPPAFVPPPVRPMFPILPPGQSVEFKQSLVVSRAPMVSRPQAVSFRQAIPPSLSPPRRIPPMGHYGYSWPQ